MEVLHVLKGMCLAQSPHADGCKILGLLAIWDGDCPGVDAPEEANIRDGGGKGDIFLVFPRYTQFVGQAVNVHHAVTKLHVCAGTWRSL
jgi:hypothetical protein